MGQLREQLAAEREEKGRQDTRERKARMAELAALLQAANRVMLTGGQNLSTEQNSSRPSSPEVSLEDRGEEPGDHWQLDLEGIELVEWNNNLSRRLLQYSRLLKEDKTNRLEDVDEDDEEVKLCLSSLCSRLEEIQSHKDRDREQQQLAGDSMREGEIPGPVPVPAPAPAPVPVPAPAPASAMFPKTQATQTDPLYMVEEKMDEKRSSGRVWTWFRGLVGWILVVVIMLSLLTELEYEGRLYRPITYYPLRCLSWLPVPPPAIRLRREVVVW